MVFIYVLKLKNDKNLIIKTFMITKEKIKSKNFKIKVKKYIFFEVVSLFKKKVRSDWVTN